VGEKMQLVVCDLAGTLVQDPNLVLECLLHGAREADLKTSPEELNGLMGRDKLEVFRILASRLASSGTEQETSAQVAFAAFRARMLQVYESNCVPIKGAQAALRELREAGLRIAVNTGFDAQIRDAILRHLDWGIDVIDWAVAASEVRRGRPAPDMVFHAMMALSVDEAKHVVKVGDSLADLAEGCNAGCGAVVGVLSGAGKVGELMRARHTHLLPSIAELPALARAEGWM
jgi:phosphonatase-like hydrolase